MVTRHAELAALRERVTAGRVDDWIDEHRHALDMVVLAWLDATVDADASAHLAADPMSAVLRAAAAGVRGGVVQVRADAAPGLLDAGVGDRLELELDVPAVAVVVARTSSGRRRPHPRRGAATALPRVARRPPRRRPHHLVLGSPASDGLMSGRHLRRDPPKRRIRTAVRRRTGSRVPLVLQQTLTDCAPACLAMILASHGRPVDLDELRDELGSGRDGVSPRPYCATSPCTVVCNTGPCGWRRRSCTGCRRRSSPIGTTTTSWWSPRPRAPASGSPTRRSGGAPSRPVTSRGTTPGWSNSSRRPPFVGPPGRRPAAWRRGGRSCVRHSPGSAGTVGRLAVTAAILLAAGAVVPLLTGVVVSWIAGSERTDGAGWLLAAAGLLLAVAVGGLALLRGLLSGAVQVAVGRNLTGSLVDRLLRAPLLFFEHRGRGDVISRVSATESVRDAVAGNLVAAVLDAVAAVGYLGIVFFVDVRVGALTAGLAAAQLLVLGTLAVAMQRVRREELLAEAHTHSGLLEAVGGIAWLKAAGAEGAAGGAWAARHEEQLGSLRRTSRLGAAADAIAAAFRTVGPLVVLVAAGMSLLAAGAGGTGPVTNGADLGRVVGVTALATAALMPFSSLAGHLRDLLQLASVATHLGDLLGAPAEPTGTGRPTLRGAATLRGVSFRHTRRAPWVVHDVDLDIPQGAKVAIVGPSGSGKSTLAKLLVGLYQPTDGAVLIDGTPLADLDLTAFRKQIGVVLQEPFLVTGSLRDNIALRRPDATLDEVIEAAVAAGIHAEIERMPAGYQTLVTEGGVGLSGGQRQRVALARALVGRPRLLVLDEATSHVDQHTESVIDANLRELGVTQVVIAHRLSTVRDADLIVVVEDGRIVEQGTHDELLARRRRLRPADRRRGRRRTSPHRTGFISAPGRGRVKAPPLRDAAGSGSSCRPTGSGE